MLGGLRSSVPSAQIMSPPGTNSPGEVMALVPGFAHCIWGHDVVVGARVLCFPAVPASAAEQQYPGQLLREPVQARQSL